MAIQIQGTQVISDSRALESVSIKLDATPSVVVTDIIDSAAGINTTAPREAAIFTEKALMDNIITPLYGKVNDAVNPTDADFSTTDLVVKNLTADAATGVITAFQFDGDGSRLTSLDAASITAAGTATSPNEFQVAYAEYKVVGQVRNWTFDVERSEIDVTTIGQTPGQYVPFRNYISGFGDGSGSADVYMTNEDAAISNRMIEDVLQRQQGGAAIKLYIDRVYSGGSLSDTLSRFIEFDAVLTSASMNVNPDDAQSVAINFRPAATPSFDFSTT